MFTVTAEEVMVEGNASTLPPGTEQGYGLLACSAEGYQANRLRIQASTDGEPGYEIERFVELEEGDCQPGGGVGIRLVIARDGGRSVQRAAR